MPLTKAQCPNCGGALEVDASKEAAVCPFCNTPYIVEKAINNYTTNITNNIQADTVIVQQSTDSDFEIENVTLKRYKGHSKNIVIPDFIEKISDDAFKDREKHGFGFIESIIFPDSVSEIGYTKYFHSHTFTGYPFNYEKMESGDDISIWAYAQRCYGAFQGCKGLQSIVFGNGLKKIGPCTFRKCGLKSIIIPEGVMEIGPYAFENCSTLSSVTIPASVKKIGSYAFANCEELTSFTVYSDFDLTEIDSTVFKGSYNLAYVFVNSNNPHYIMI